MGRKIRRFLPKTQTITYERHILPEVRVDFQCRVIFTCVKFTFANKIEALHERSLVSVKVEPRSTSRLS